MNNLYQQALSSMAPDDVAFILARLPAQDVVQILRTPPAPSIPKKRLRRRGERDLPEVGTILSANYFNADYRAEIIQGTGNKQFKKQILLILGESDGVICDTLAEAMRRVVDKERQEHGFSWKISLSGWDFWRWEGKPEKYKYIDRR